MPAPKHKPKAIPKPTLSVAFPIIIPASNPIPAPKDILDFFIFKYNQYVGLEVAELKEEDMPMI